MGEERETSEDAPMPPLRRASAGEHRHRAWLAGSTRVDDPERSGTAGGSSSIAPTARARNSAATTRGIAQDRRTVPRPGQEARRQIRADPTALVYRAAPYVISPALRSRLRMSWTSRECDFSHACDHCLRALISSRAPARAALISASPERGARRFETSRGVGRRGADTLDRLLTRPGTAPRAPPMRTVPGVAAPGSRSRRASWR